jgi:hypothetical protein
LIFAARKGVIHISPQDATLPKRQIIIPSAGKAAGFIECTKLIRPDFLQHGTV